MVFHFCWLFPCASLSLPTNASPETRTRPVFPAVKLFCIFMASSTQTSCPSVTCQKKCFSSVLVHLGFVSTRTVSHGEESAVGATRMLTGCPSSTAIDFTRPGIGAITMVETSTVARSGMYFKYFATSTSRTSAPYCNKSKRWRRHEKQWWQHKWWNHRCLVCECTYNSSVVLQLDVAVVGSRVELERVRRTVDDDTDNWTGQVNRSFDSQHFSIDFNLTQHKRTHPEATITQPEDNKKPTHYFWFHLSE